MIGGSEENNVNVLKNEQHLAQFVVVGRPCPAFGLSPKVSTRAHGFSVL